MAEQPGTPSARQTELLESAYRYVLLHGLADLSLRPLAAAIGSSPRVLLYLFDSKDGLIRALLARARTDELAMLEQIRTTDPGMIGTAERVWGWLADPGHRGLSRLWLESYSRSLVATDGPLAGFAAGTVADWLMVLADAQPVGERESTEAIARRVGVLAVLRGGLLDLLATDDLSRIDVAVRQALATFG